MSGSSDKPVLFERRADHIALVTINRPDARNAINPAVTQAMEVVLNETEDDPDLRVVILTGAGGKVFSAGADLKEVARGNLDGLMTPTGGLAAFVHAKRNKPWIAAVEGLALAGGCEIALACDMIVASEGGAFGLPEVTRGLAAAAGGLYRLPRVLPRAIAIELIVTADRISSERAAAFGMINRLAPAGRVIEEALRLAASIAANAPLAVGESLAIARAAEDFDDVTLRAMSETAQDRLKLTEDFVEGPLAFIEKRAPAWKGR